MAFTRRMGLHRRRRRTTRRRRTRGRRPRMTTGRVKRIIDAELKFKDEFIANLAMPSGAGIIVNLSGIDQGDSQSERIGNWIKPVTLYGTLNVQADEANAEPNQPFRIMIVQWRENQDNDPISLLSLVQNVNEPFQGYNIQSKGSFKILHTWVSTVIGNTDNSQYIKTHRFYVKPSTKILFDDTLQRKYNLFLVAFSDKALLAPTLFGNVRLRYTDS